MSSAAARSVMLCDYALRLMLSLVFEKQIYQLLLVF